MSAPTPAPNAPPIPNWKDMSREEQIRMTELCNDFQSRRSMSTTTTNLSDAGTLNTTPNGFSQAAIDRKFQETKPEYTNWLQAQPQYQQQQSQQQQPQQQQQLPFHLPPSLSQPPQQMSAFGQPQIQTQPQQQPQSPFLNHSIPSQPVQISSQLQSILSPRLQQQLFATPSQQDPFQPAVSIQPNQQLQAQTQVPSTPIVPGHFPSPVQGRESQAATVQTSQHPPSMAFSTPAPAAQNWLQSSTPNVASLMANYKPAPTPNADRSQLLAENNAMIESVSMAWKQLAHQMVDMEATFRRLVIERRDLMHKGLLAEEEEEDAALLASPTAGRGAGKKKNRTSKKDKRLASGFSRT
ncbi:hypothetical protein GQ607_015221 [Colletotrichum asianum]|uniref:Uncharacterized protein n=1 Tax=Colletotrichum asianum TaxID=702518 RepID=A0A8H3VY44_9PEZI|nr:hypothetical protein GQ607_015221 [Colletotrichum asianum]